MLEGEKVIRARWMEFCGKAFDRADLSMRGRVGGTPKVFPLDRVSLRELLSEIRLYDESGPTTATILPSECVWL